MFKRDKNRIFPICKAARLLVFKKLSFNRINLLICARAWQRANEANEKMPLSLINSRVPRRIFANSKSKFQCKSPESSSLSWFDSILNAGLWLGGVSDSLLRDASASSLSRITKHKVAWWLSDAIVEFGHSAHVARPMLIKPFNFEFNCRSRIRFVSRDLPTVARL